MTVNLPDLRSCAIRCNVRLCHQNVPMIGFCTRFAQQNRVVHPLRGRLLRQ